MKLLKQLSYADYLTLLTFPTSLAAIYLLIIGKPFMAINVSLIALVLDLSDGFVAKKFNQKSSMGSLLDAHADVFTYLIFTCLLFFVYISQNFFFGLVVVLVVFIFGILRLTRYATEGLIKQYGHKYYKGCPVYYPYFSALFFFFIIQITGSFAGYIAGSILILLSFLMISEYKIRHIRNLNVIVILFTSIFILNWYAH